MCLFSCVISELLKAISVESDEYRREILQVLQQFYKDKESVNHFSYFNPFLVQNVALQNDVSVDIKLVILA